MTRGILYILIPFLVLSCKPKAELKVSVEADSPLVEVDILTLKNKLPLSKENTYIVKTTEGKILPSQITYNNRLLFKTDDEATGKQDFIITLGKQQIFEPLVFGRFFPERYDDFAWENDKVGFRFYGKALKEIQAPTNGLDLWYKRTSRLVLEDWYRDNISGKASYHTDHGEGCDPYGVGPSLGAGAMAPYIDGQLIRNENYVSYEILDNGPLRITAKLIYPKLKIGDKEIEDTRTVSLDAGSQYTKITQSYGNAKFAVAAGIVKRSSGDSIIISDQKTNIIYAEPMEEKNGQVYLALIFPSGFDRDEINTYQIEKNSFTHVLAISHYDGKPITYYTGFGWNKFGFDDIAAFKDYTTQYVDKLNLNQEINIEQKLK